MTNNNDRLDKVEKVNSFLAGIEIVLSELNDNARFPSDELANAKSLVIQAQRAIKKEITKLKRSANGRRDD